MLGTAVVLTAASTGCRKNDFNINKNPNQPTDSTVTYDVILPAALHGTGDIVGSDWGWLQNWMGYWARSGGYAPDNTEETYQITTSFQTRLWNDLYNNAYDYQVMQNKANQSGAKFYEGIARIMKANNFQILVDIYNNVPYFEALKGSNNVTPKYNKGVDIYKDLFREIDAGISLIKAADYDVNKNVETNDIMFGTGDVKDSTLQKTMWYKLGNTLKLRMLVHLHNDLVFAQVAPGIDITAEMAKIATEGNGFLMAGQDARINPGYREDKPNPFYETYVADANGDATGSSAYYKANKWGINYYGYNNDPRQSFFYKAGKDGMKGVEYGLPAANENVAANLAAIGDGLTGGSHGSEREQWVLTATESLFLQAEAQERGFFAGDPKITLNEAITESFNWLGLTSTQAAANYIAGNAGYEDVDYDQSVATQGNGLFTILSQKWFAMNGVAPYETWTDFRRTGIVYGEVVGYTPGLPISVSPNNTATKIPTRLLYPQTEYNYNAANVGAEGMVERYGRIFWDLN